ncbi:MAG: amino acid ABC transporter permease [Lentilactobacillus diolivorans]
MSFNPTYMINSFKLCTRYIGTTLFMALVSLIIGLALGIGIALIRTYKIPLLARFFEIIITILKGVPIVLVILGSYLLMSQQFNHFAKSLGWSIQFKNVDPIWIAIFALGLMAIVNVSEIFRGIFVSIPKGQYDAAKSIGLTTTQMIRKIMIPQSIPIAIPMLSNLLINLIKASALASMVGVVDIFAEASISAQQNYSFLEGYVAVAIIYWIMSLIIERGATFLERALTR